MLGTILLISLSGLLAYHYLRPMRIPGPRGIPLADNLLNVWKNVDRFDDWWVEMINTYGDTFLLRQLGMPDLVVTTNPKNVEHILKTKFESYEKGPVFRNTLHDLLGNGIFNSDGEEWRPQRKITSNLFNVKNFREGMFHVFVDHSKAVLDLIEKSRDNADVSDLFYRYTLDSIGCIAFGQDIKSLENPEVEFAKVWDRANPLIFDRFNSVGVLRKLNPVEKEIAKDIQTMNAFANEILESRKKEDPEKLASSYDLLSLFMSKKNRDGEDYSDEYLRDMILNMIIAGRDTTAQSLAWTCYLLAKHPRVQEKVKKEVDEVLGKADPDYDSIKGLEYLHAVVTESLRLYPSVPRDPHTAGSDDILPTGHHVKKGSWVFYFAYGMGRSKELWGDDCYEFRPERHIEDPKLASNPFKFTAFQGGPRTCLGQNMAYLEEQTILAMIFQKYDFELIPGQDIRIQLSLTLPMVNNLRLKFTPRMEK